jgi:nonribosomal peptide synthetase DhbF
VPFEWVLAELNPRRSPGRPPYTDVMLMLHDHATLDLPDAATRVTPVRPAAARFPVSIEVWPRPGPDGTPAGLDLAVGYATDAYDGPALDWLADAVLAVLDAMTTAPDDRLSAVALPAPPRRPATPPTRSAPAPAPAPAPASPTPAPLAPAPPDGWSPSERRIAAIWCDVLGLDRVDPEANFFDLGGTSLGAVRVAARLTAAEGRPVTAASIFLAPTVAALARQLVADGGDRTAGRPAIPRRPRIPVEPA